MLINNTGLAALLNGQIVEQFTAATSLSFLPDTSQASNLTGFTGIQFDEMQIQLSTIYLQIDNLQSAGGTAAVPEPTSLAVFGVGAVGLLLAKRRRKITR